jgi:hypothetical protein
LRRSQDIQTFLDWPVFKKGWSAWAGHSPWSLVSVISFIGCKKEGKRRQRTERGPQRIFSSSPTPPWSRQNSSREWITELEGTPASRFIMTRAMNVLKATANSTVHQVLGYVPHRTRKVGWQAAAGWLTMTSACLCTCRRKLTHVITSTYGFHYMHQSASSKVESHSPGQSIRAPWLLYIPLALTQ